MNNQISPIRKISVFLLTAQIGMAIAGISYAIGNKAGFGSFVLTDEVVNSIIGYDNVMSAFLKSALWQISSFMLLLALPKWFIYQDRSKKLWYSLLIYYLLPFVVWITLDGVLRFLGFSIIATMVWIEAIMNWYSQPRSRKYP